MINARKSIDDLDRQIIELLLKRKELILEIFKYKKKNGILFYYKNRENEIFENVEKKALDSGLDPKLIRKIFEQILKMKDVL